MSKQICSPLSDISEEKSISLSVDSLENTDDFFNEVSKTVGCLNRTDSGNADSPSFHNVLASSHCDVAPNSKPATFVDNTETLQNLAQAVLTLNKDASEVFQGPSAAHRSEKVSQMYKAEKHACERSDIDTHGPASHARNEEKSTSIILPNTISKSEQRRATTKTTAGKQHSRIPVAILNPPVIDRLPQNIGKRGHIGSEPHPAFTGANVSKCLSHKCTKAPKNVERCRSHHTIERPTKDFIQLNKQGEFLRAKTYHSLHLERRREYEEEERITAPSTFSAVASAAGVPSVSASPQAGELSSPSDDPPEPSDRSRGAGSSSQSADPCSPAAVPERSGRRHSSHIPIRVGPLTTPDRRHQSSESPRSREARGPRLECTVNEDASRRELTEGRPEFHELRHSHGSSESDLAVPGLCSPRSQLILIDVTDNRRLLSEVSAPSLLDHQYHGHRRSEDLIIPDSVSSLSLQLPGYRKVFTPPERVPMPHRHVEYQPNLKPYPRQYINLGKLGPDPDTVRARQERVQKQQDYAERITRKNRTVVKQKSQQYSKQHERTQSAHDKMVNYARTVPKPRQKPKPLPITPSKEAREASPIAKIRQLLAENVKGSQLAPSGKLPEKRSNSLSSRMPSVMSTYRQGQESPRPEAEASAKSPPVGRTVVRRQHNVSVPESRQPPQALSTFEAPKTSALPPKDNRRYTRRMPGRSASAGHARVASSLTRLRSLTDQLVAGPLAAHSVGDPSRKSRRDSCLTVGASSDVESDYSADSLISVAGPAVVSRGLSHGSRPPRGRGLFPPARSGPNCRRPMIRCSRGVGPDPPGLPSRSATEDFFYDTCSGDGECACGENSCSPPLSPNRRPVVTRGTQPERTLNDTFVLYKNPLLVDIGMPVGNKRERRSSPRSRLGDHSSGLLSLMNSPPGDSQTRRPDDVNPNASTLQMMRERYLRDKRRVDAIISGSITKM